MEGLETALIQEPLSERLLQGAKRAKSAWNGQAETPNFLRADQCSVYADFLDYLWETATNGDEDGQPPMARIVQPPRTGKTVIASQIIAGTGLTATVIVPSKVLIKQTVEEMRRWLPGVPIGMFYGENKDVVENGVNVATYAILQQRIKNNDVPHAIGSSALIFADEGHQSMTSHRQNVLRFAFDRFAIRIALTATPDYSEDRTLCRFFPDLIHEITFDEAIRLDLLAPYRFWLGEVDVSGSRVRMYGGDYVDDDIGRLMSEAPFFKAVEMFRYAERNRRLGALICCATCEQATQLTAYLKLHRPADLPHPQLILGSTPEKERDNILRRFENGRADTLINVGVLVQGWNSPRCKLLIDLAPSTSRVRAAQKFSRPLTRDGDREARIVMFVPKELPVMPLLPVELFGTSLTSYTAGDLIGSRTANGTRTANDAAEIVRTPIKDVILKSRIVFTQTQRQPKLDPKDLPAIRRVLESCPDFNPNEPPTYRSFRWLMFRHDLFQGRGLQLLHHLGLSSVKTGYFNFLAKTFPDGASRKFIPRHDRYKDKHGLDEDTLSAADLRAWYAENAPAGFEATMEERDECSYVRNLLVCLKPIELRIIKWRFGLEGEDELTLKQIGEKYNLSSERIRSLQEQGLEKLRKQMLQEEEDCLSKLVNSDGPNQTANSSTFFGPNVISPSGLRWDDIPFLNEQIKEYGEKRYRKLVLECERLSIMNSCIDRLAKRWDVLPGRVELKRYGTDIQRRDYLASLVAYRRNMSPSQFSRYDHGYWNDISSYIRFLGEYWGISP